MKNRINFIIFIILISFLHPTLTDTQLALPLKFTVGNYKLADHVIKHLKADSENNKVVTKINDYDAQLPTQQHQELFREIINESTERNAVSHQQLLDIVDKAFAMTNKAIKFTNPTKSLTSKLLTKSKATISKLFKSEKTISDIPELMSKALRGDATAIHDLQTINPSSLESLPVAQKRIILQTLQDKADKLLNEINEHVANQTMSFNSSDLADDTFEHSIKDLSLEHTAKTLATMKYCKDVIAALKPICTTSQSIMFTVDRHQINPLINFIDMKNFSFDPTATAQQQNATLKLEAKTLAKQGLLQIPQHAKTIPTFYEQLKEHIMQYHSTIHAKQIFNEIQKVGNDSDYSSDTENTEPADRVFAKHNFFKNFTPEYKEIFLEHLNTLLNYHETQQTTVEDMHGR